ncbi:unnamed protein product [Haemonchus placei]|uniref:Galactokinase n=1 Tax=Haemonchus placei TaxID=6290 RepID=A0A158QLX8_HAEPC|nr:unnamed protein product [Haemonchus placei]
MNAEMFTDVYGHAPTVRVFCPGHLNLIGEHIAEHGFGTIATATDTGTEILAALNDRAEIRFVNTDEDYRSCSISLPTDWNGTTCPEWFDYLLAGWKGILERLKVDAIGFDILMEGCIPSSVGLSSSSSIVCAAALTTLALHTGKSFEGISREELATLCANAEQYVGQRGDRTVHLTQVLGSEDMAVRFDFFPLRTRLVNIPPIAVFDVLNCGEKPRMTPSLREQRFVEGLIAGKLLLKNAGKTCIYSRLKDVKEALGKRLDDMLALCENLPEMATKEELTQLLGPEDFEECFAEGTSYSSPFKLRSVARHVFSEALRVEKFERACETRDLFGMGRYFNECHESCSKDFECSSAAADKLVAKCRMARAYGAHVCGLSGTVVALIDDIRPVFLGDNLVYHAFSSPGASVEFL